MIHLPSRPCAIALATAAGLGLCCPVFLPRATAQTVDGAPVLAPNPESAQPMAAPGMAHTDAQGRHLAPRGTFYIVSYVSAKTDKGVTGFVPGQEVKFVRVNQEERKLVVSDGKTEVEVSPGQLTNDMDMAAMVRQKDENNQARIAAHLQAEEAAYRKYERELAEQSAQGVKESEQRRVAQSAVAQTAQANTSATTAEPVADTGVAAVNSGYYGAGGYGYGNPYSYFAGETTVLGTGRQAGQNNGNNPSAQSAADGNRTGASRTNGGTTNPSATGTATSATANAGTAANAGTSNPSATGTATSATAGGGNKGTAPANGAPSSGTSAGSRGGGGGGGRP